MHVFLVYLEREALFKVYKKCKFCVAVDLTHITGKFFKDVVFHFYGFQHGIAFCCFFITFSDMKGNCIS